MLHNKLLLVYQSIEKIKAQKIDCVFIIDYYIFIYKKNMFEIEKIFSKDYSLRDGTYNCLPEDTKENKIKKQELETYSNRADNFNEQAMLSLSEELQSVIEPITKLPKDSVVLELAGGDGRFAFYLMNKGYTVIESDIAPGSVQKVKQIAEKNNIKNGIYAVLDAEDLPFKDNSLEAIFMVASLHHLPNPQKALKEVSRVLKNNGLFLILREPASWQYYFFGPVFFILRKLLRKKNKNDFSLADDVTWGFSKRKLNKLLSPHFTDIKIKPVHYLRKIYTNWVVLKTKITKKKHFPNQKIEKILKQIDDKFIAKIPLIKHLAWDFDIYTKKK